eukprot:TRINITY_DN10828_c0_g1_i4.p1 TRINITY_DN10828_c0_g1~~TRINITY_DN10828_c0_g1_i4.p1  ORF type:complete len:116 (-),score=17.53 TRINITY_DN10828_c0_g1_i4:87-434(-)
MCIRDRKGADMAMLPQVIRFHSESSISVSPASRRRATPISPIPLRSKFASPRQSTFNEGVDEVIEIPTAPSLDQFSSTSENTSYDVLSTRSGAFNAQIRDETFNKNNEYLSIFNR